MAELPLCPTCGEHRLSSKTAKRCRRCYVERRGIESVSLPKKKCVECGKPVSNRGATRCRLCWREQRGIESIVTKRKAEKEAERERVAKEAAAMIREPLKTYEEGYQRWRETIGAMRDRYKGPASKGPVTARRRILVIPDLHIPFVEETQFAAMLSREAKKTDLAIQRRDVSDSYSLSRLAKHDPVNFRDEAAQITLYMEQLSEHIPETRIIVGNHDARLRKALANQLTPDMVDAVRAMTPGGTLCPITALAKKFSNVSVANHQLPDSEITVDWMTRIGDAVLAHPERYSRVPGSALRQFEDWVRDQALNFGLEDIRLLVMGHTHSYSMIPWRADSLLVECGCLLKNPMVYQTQASLGGRPQRRGYLTFDQIGGRTDLNSVRFWWFDVEESAPWSR